MCLFSIFLLDNNYLKSQWKSELLLNKYVQKELNNSDNFIKVYSINYKDINSEKLLKNDIKYLYNLLVNNQDNDNQYEDDNQLQTEIESDIQYEEDSTFYAEGNVVIYISDAKITADKLAYNRVSRNLIIEGKVIFNKGSQYFEADKFSYNFFDKTGYLDNIYGLIEIDKISYDLDLESEIGNPDNDIDYNNVLQDLQYSNTATFGLLNDFEDEKKFNLTEIKLIIPKVTRWRFKADKIFIQEKKIYSDEILFTNDAFNAPQFILKSKGFSGEIIDEKIKFISRNSWLVLDEKVSFPIGRRTIFDREAISKWTIGSDYNEKDGFFISRGFNEQKLTDNIFYRIRTYFLFQRALKGNTNSFREENTSILSDKKQTENKFLDIFALDLDVYGNINEWDLELNSNFNSLDTNRMSESIRSKLTLTREIKLNQWNNNLSRLENDKSNWNLVPKKINLQLYSAFRERVFRGFSGEEEIYFATGLTLWNRSEWASKSFNNSFQIAYDLGEFNAETRDGSSLSTLGRNLFAAKYSVNFPIWKKKDIDKKINEEYKYSPKVIEQEIIWNNTLNSSLFLYSDGSQQNAISFSTGPNITLGSFKKNFFDYTNIDVSAKYVFKDGLSPFKFDDIDSTNRLEFSLDQQIIGPLVYGYDAYVSLDSNSEDYGKFSKGKYTLTLKRRAYSIGAFYDTSAESIGIQFNIYNFDYSGLNPKF